MVAAKRANVPAVTSVNLVSSNAHMCLDVGGPKETQ